MKKRVPLNRSGESKLGFERGGRRNSKCTLLGTRFLTMGVLSV